MARPEVIPITPLLARLRGLPASRGQRLALAEELAADSTPLVAEIQASVALLADFDAGEQAFRGTRPALVRELAEVAHRERGVRTADFAFWLQSRGHLDVALDPQLDCVYVDRELVPTGGARRGRGSVGPRPPALRVDLLLANAAPADRTPVVAEVKIGLDKDPFAGLLQALAGVVALATPSQYRRLRAAYPQAQFPERDPAPPLDAYVLCVDPAWETPLMGELLLAAREIARNLSRCPATAAILRRAALLRVSRQAGSLWSEAVRL